MRELDLPRPSVRLFLNGDEEIGSPASRPHIERLSEDATATLVCEASAGPEGALKTSRKGVGLFEVTVEGVEAHAGLDPYRGASAVHALAELVIRIAGLGSRERGTTVNVGMGGGGTGRNVIAGRASCGIDVRVPDPAEAARIDAALVSLAPSDPRVRVSVTGGWNRPPDGADARLPAPVRAGAGGSAGAGVAPAGDGRRRGERRQLRLRARPSRPRRPGRGR